jgi:hypothetical protein
MAFPFRGTLIEQAYGFGGSGGGSSSDLQTDYDNGATSGRNAVIDLSDTVGALSLVDAATPLAGHTLFQITNNAGDQVYLGVNNNSTQKIRSNATDGAGVVGVLVDTVNHFTTGGTAFRVQTGGATRLDVSETAVNDDTVLMISRRQGGTWSAVQRVTEGAADSGGAGFRLLRIPN